MSKRDGATEAIQHILRLRRAEARADPGVRDDIAGAREYIERLVGPTVRPATAAHVLGVSQTALARWLDLGEIASVLTTAGRREIPLAELVDLLEVGEQLGPTAAKRPLAAVVGMRRRAAEEAVDIDRLLPARRPRTHREAELHGLAYHRLVADRLDDRIVEQARRRLARWRADDRIHPRWADEWERILSLPLPGIARTISADTPRARALRQTSPFSGVLNEQERRRLVEAVERRISA